MKDRFKGRASRAEWWKTFVFAILFCVIGAILIAIAKFIIRGIDFGYQTEPYLPVTEVFNNLIPLILYLSILAVSARRFHDLDRTGWWAALIFLPIAGWLAIIVWCGLVRGAVGHNSFGPDPRNRVLIKKPVNKKRLIVASVGALALFVIGVLATAFYGFEGAEARLDRIAHHPAVVVGLHFVSHRSARGFPATRWR